MTQDRCFRIEALSSLLFYHDDKGHSRPIFDQKRAIRFYTLKCWWTTMTCKRWGNATHAKTIESSPLCQNIEPEIWVLVPWGGEVEGWAASRRPISDIFALGFCQAGWLQLTILQGMSHCWPGGIRGVFMACCGNSCVAFLPPKRHVQSPNMPKTIGIWNELRCLSQHLFIFEIAIGVLGTIYDVMQVHCEVAWPEIRHLIL